MLSRFARSLLIPTKDNTAFEVDLLEARWLLAANAAPVLDPIQDVTVPADKPYILPFTASDTNDSQALKYSISTTGNVNLKLHKNNPFLRLSIDEEVPAKPATRVAPAVPAQTNHLGTMTFELLADLAPNTVSIIKSLVQAGFYNHLTFHRIADLAAGTGKPQFIVQGGDQAGTGSGTFPFQYDDEFSKQALFPRPGQPA